MTFSLTGVDADVHAHDFEWLIVAGDHLDLVPLFFVQDVGGKLVDKTSDAFIY
ncbi:hypothetical protein HN588_07715, partial [Candidatus Bathyarchaeota archaeon]|nr:hypothetical protein [Candidatus Bathyarchaeota archaeon]